MIRAVALPLAFVLAGCNASQAGYPSLAPRAIERGEAPVAPTPAAAADPAIDARAARLVTDAQAADADFQREAATTRRAVDRAGARESETWLDAQLAFTALGAKRARTAGLLDDAEALRFEVAGGSAAVDTTRILAAIETISTLDAAQAATLTELGARLN